jgi:hypothetical protein
MLEAVLFSLRHSATVLSGPRLHESLVRKDLGQTRRRYPRSRPMPKKPNMTAQNQPDGRQDPQNSEKIGRQTNFR